MGFAFRTMTEQDAVAIASWQYPEEYSFYNAENDQEDKAELLNPANWGNKYYAVYNDYEELVGLFCLEYDQGKNQVSFGLGLRPDLCGKGNGLPFTEACLDILKIFYPDSEIALQVACFNKRAIKVYEAAGFCKTRTFMQETNGGEYQFQEMVYKETAKGGNM